MKLYLTKLGIYFGIFVIFISIVVTNIWQTKAASLPEAKWASSTTVGPDNSLFRSVSFAPSGNIYAVGYIYGNSQFDFGNNITATGAAGSSKHNAVIVKYNSAGLAQCANSTTTATNYTRFYWLDIDSSENIYAVGRIYSNTQVNFGNNVTVNGAGTTENLLIVKYNSNCEAQWAHSTVVAPNASTFHAVDIDGSGNVYIAGVLTGNGQFNLGNGVTVSGAAGGTSENTLLVKYNSDGLVQWARSTTVAPSASALYAVSIDSSGNIYTSGNICGNGVYNFGNNVTVNGAAGGTTGTLVLIKYNASGDAQWARSTTTAPDGSYFWGLKVDQSGNIYGAGEIRGTSQYDFGNNVTASGTYASSNLFLIKYDSSGTAQWARSTVASQNISYLCSVDTDYYGNIYVGGYITGNAQFDIGNSVAVTGGSTGFNTFVAKYSSSGTAQWARTTVTAPDASLFYRAIVDNLGNNIYAAGRINGNGQFDFGDNITVNVGAGSGKNNAFVMKYYSAPSGPIYNNLPNDNRRINIDENQIIISNPYFIKVRPVDDGGISKVEFYIDHVLICTKTQADSDGVYSCAWDTSRYHSLVTVIAYNNLGLSVSIDVNTIVALNGVLPNTGADLASIVVAINILLIVGYQFFLKKISQNHSPYR